MNAPLPLPLPEATGARQRRIGEVVLEVRNISLGFGGVGYSGSGRHHGVDGFREFSNPRGVVYRGEGGMLEAFLPPYGEQTQALLSSIFGG